MFTPHYVITDKLLANIKRVNVLVKELNDRRFPHIVLAEFEKTAQAVSTYASTSIEGNPLPLTEVKRILKRRPAYIRDSEKEVLNYNQALRVLSKQLEKEKIILSLPFILKIQKQVMNGLLPIFEVGKLREKPVVINDPIAQKVVYLPPDAKDVKKLMESLFDFVNKSRDSIDPLILAGIFHKQMVIIHPFMDGNGRTTRLATKVLLTEMGLNTFNLFSFENYYNNNVTRYFKTVGEFGNYYEVCNVIDFTPFLEYFTEGLIDELLRVQKLLPLVSLTPQTTIQPYHTRMLTFIREKGFIADRDYAKLTNRAKATRTKDFKKLLNLGLLERKEKGKATYYILKGK